jgi:hypothetical protein
LPRTRYRTPDDGNADNPFAERGPKRELVALHFGVVTVMLAHKVVSFL